mgnify:CR=1 FL=1
MGLGLGLGLAHGLPHLNLDAEEQRRLEQGEG